MFRRRHSMSPPALPATIAAHAQPLLFRRSRPDVTVIAVTPPEPAPADDGVRHE